MYTSQFATRVELNSAITSDVPEDDWDWMVFTLLTAATAFSIFFVTILSISWGPAPEYVVITMAIGKFIFGIKSIATLDRDINPNTSTISTHINTVTGLFIAVSCIFNI
jgi:hypothetical protein